MPLDANHNFIRVNGVRTHFLRAGAGDTLLYLHGSGGAGQWPAAFARLADQFDVVSPAHPGFGQSERPEWMDTIRDMAFHYLDFMDELGLERVHLIGMSTGGWIAAEVAAMASHRLRSLTLVDAAGLRVEGAPVPDVFALNREAQTRLVFHDQSLADKALAAELDDEGMAAYIQNQTMLALLAWDPYLHDPKLPHRLRRVACPTLVVWGREDRLIPVAHAEAYASLIAGAEVSVIPECGHIPHEEAEDEFVRLASSFLASC